MLLLTLMLWTASAAGHTQLGQQTNPSAKPESLALTGPVGGVHDPSLAREGDTYYLFSSLSEVLPGQPRNPDLRDRPQLPIRCSQDLHAWRHCGTVFPSIPGWIRTFSPDTTELWAPDVSFFDGVYHVYYVISIAGRNTSGIALVTNETLDSSSPKYKWVDHGLVLSTRAEDDRNAIDPDVQLDPGGRLWMTFGSFWTGIKLVELNRATGLPLARGGKLYSLATRARLADPADLRNYAVEGPVLFQHDGCFYLFVSWDFCCRGANSNYREMVGRSRRITGPYVDRNGRKMMDGGGSEVLVGNKVWAGPGGASLFHDQDRDLIVFHAYSAVDGRFALQVSTVVWVDDWPEAAMSTAPEPPRRQPPPSPTPGTP